ncbi:MAG: branched-chain amino acid ABC transporter permease [bacterium]|nr:branched-chain amino acid ABC transporter permease [bacterium]MDE0233966.1 branched-chain amino acid ABC transporter permease [bacterium]
MTLAAIDWGFILIQTVETSLGLEAAVYALAAVGLNIHFGYAGLLNFGQVGFVAMGAYGMGLSVTLWNLNPFLAVLVGMGFATVFALILGVPTLRLRGDYLAIVTIAAAEIIRILARSTTLGDITRGAEGLHGFIGPFRELNPFDPSTEYGIGPFQVGGNQFFAIVLGWGVTAICLVLIWQLMRSPWGRVVKAIREDEDAARALGKNAYWYKLQALILGGVIGGLAGMVQAIGKATIQPDSFVPAYTFFFWTVLILGGVGRIWSPVVGAMIFWAMLTFFQGTLIALVNDGLIPTAFMDPTQVNQIRFMLVGVGLALLMVFRPQGIFGSREEMMLDVR